MSKMMYEEMMGNLSFYAFTKKIDNMSGREVLQWLISWGWTKARVMRMMRLQYWKAVHYWWTGEYPPTKKHTKRLRNIAKYFAYYVRLQEKKKQKKT